MTVVVDGSTGVSVVGTTGFTSQTNGLGTGLVPAEQYYRLNSSLAGANATGAQSILGVGVTLVGSTVYQFESVFAMSKSAGTTAYTISMLFGGTATLNNISYEILSTIDNTAFASTSPLLTFNQFIQTASATVIKPSSSTAVGFAQYLVKGTVSVNAGGTFIPQYSLSAAPGGAYTVAAGSYFKIAPLAASGANVNIGSWA